jgi:hypothetical protein
MVEIVPGDDVPKLTLILTQDVGRVDGVTLKSDTPVAGAMIVLVPEDAVHHAQSFRCSQSDSDGTFTLAPVVPGKYTILAIQDGWELEWANPEVLKPYLAQGLVIQVEPKGKYEVKVKIQQLAIAANKTGK